MKKGVLRNFTKFAGKHLCQSLFFNKVAGLNHKSDFFLNKIDFRASKIQSLEEK